MTKYLYRTAINAFFAVDEAAAKKLLPPGLFPATYRPGSSLLSVTFFDFTACEAGPYGEMVLSVLVPPQILANSRLPHGAFFPFRLASTTAIAAQMSHDRFKLPFVSETVEMEFESNGDTHSVKASQNGKPVLNLSVKHISKYVLAQETRYYQCFIRENGLCKTDFELFGDLCEHEEQTAKLELFDHPLCNDVAEALEDLLPIREMSFSSGHEIMWPLHAYNPHG